MDLERFTSSIEVKKHPKVWQALIEQLSNGEMPPKEQIQPTAPQRKLLIAWASAVLDEIALSRAGDPGPVVLRRLSNAEYAYTIRDLTGITSLNPAREFPTDSASGEGFMNVGNSLVMSPALLGKYLDAAKDVAAHAVLLPDGIAFSPSTSQRDWTEERLAAIRTFYGRYTVNGGGSAVNLQGIKFDTKDGGVLPLEKYFAATLNERVALKSRRKTVAQVASEYGLNAKYFTMLWNAINDSKSSFLLNSIRAQWNASKPGDAGALVTSVGQWQQALWRFTTVGHIGKRDGPKTWQVPVTPLAEAREVRMKLPAAVPGNDVTLYLVASDAGDGNANDFAVWENPRLVAPGRPDLALRDIRTVVDSLAAHRTKVISTAAECLSAASEITGSPDKAAIDRLAAKHGVEPLALTSWLECLGIGAGETRIDAHITQKMESAQGYDFITGWTGADALSVIANSSDQHVRVPGNMKPHSVAVHPSPKRRVIVGWRSPVAASIQGEGVVQHAHPECGNGITWAVEVRRGTTRQRLAAGTAQGSKEIPFGPFANIGVQTGDVVCVLIGPRDGNHSCDLTAVDLNLSDGTHTWNLAKDVSPNILAGNPHADGLGNPAVWHFYSEPDTNSGSESMLPQGSLLSKWQSTTNIAERQNHASALQRLLLNGASGLPTNSPDAALHRQLTSLNGPLFRAVLQRDQTVPPLPSDARGPGRGIWGLDPAIFGKHPNGSQIPDTSLCIRAPSIIEVQIPAALAEGCDFAATTALHNETGAEGSIQMQVLTSKPADLGLAAGAVREQGSKSTWSDGERPIVSDSPILVMNGSAARKRIESGLDEFRRLFPAALCYTKIVPVDEVVTLTLFYREDDQLRRLCLDDAQAAELDRLWSELHYVSNDPLKLVDAFEQLWQFATQDADPSAFEPLREPIKQRAETFRKLLVDTQPQHLEAVLKFAERAYRHSLSDLDKNELRGLYGKLRDEEIPHEQAIRLVLARVFVAPAFLYKAEISGQGMSPSPVNDFELATRLSYFLWSSAPDTELLQLAKQGRLHQPKILAAQANRMLKDEKVRRLATEFACAWLQVYAFDELSEKSEKHFPTFANMRGSMYEETIRFFTDLFQRDLPVLNILNAPHAMLNEDLAKHYGIPNVSGPQWRRVEGVNEFSRGGILTQGTILAKQSGASRTSPILRGNWVSEVLLGERLPRPPKDVPRLPENEATESLSVRQLVEKHSSDPKCAGCHKRIDAYGFSLEEFDAIGRKRDRDLGDRPINTHATVMDGTQLDGVEGLRDYLLNKRRDAFMQQFCRKLLGYALGRGIQISDTPLLKEMQANLKSHQYKFSTAIETIVRSKQFREIRGTDAPTDE